jgi:hypothetical protein
MHGVATLTVTLAAVRARGHRERREVGGVGALGDFANAILPQKA